MASPESENTNAIDLMWRWFNQSDMQIFLCLRTDLHIMQFVYKVNISWMTMQMSYSILLPYHLWWWIETWCRPIMNFFLLYGNVASYDVTSREYKSSEFIFRYLNEIILEWMLKIWFQYAPITNSISEAKVEHFPQDVHVIIEWGHR